MELEDKKIFLILSPHINYYHSYRGDSLGESGFGQDIRIMEKILDQLDNIEEKGLCGGRTNICWDYGDTFWSIQLQKEYQEDVLKRIIERCKKGKDEVLIGSWGNVGQPFLDTEEFRTDHEWLLENSMGIGLKQLFPGRIAPYARTQESMFTQGMIEQYQQLGIEGFAMYYSVVPFDIARPFLNPRLDWNQMHGLIKFKSSVSNASILGIPMYGFGDIYDNLSINKWLELIRKKQASGEIEEHALLFLNIDMDDNTWIGIKLPSLLQWMPNSRGLMEIAEVVDRFEFVEFGNLLDVIPRLKIHGEVILREDVADGCFNGFYNWAQKPINTEFWTVGQQARWLKCISDTLSDIGLSDQAKSKIKEYIRDGNDSTNTYIKNKLLFASTTNFGMSMPLLHQHRHKTAMIYALNAHQAAYNAANLAIEEKIEKEIELLKPEKYFMMVIPVINRGVSGKEKKPVKSHVLIKSEIPDELTEVIRSKNMKVAFKGGFFGNFQHSIYPNEDNSRLKIEALLSKSNFEKKGYYTTLLSVENMSHQQINENKPLRATKKIIENENVKLEFNDKGKIISFKFDGKDYGCPNFLESSVRFGKKKGKRYCSKKDEIIVIRDGSDNFSASIKIKSEFEIRPNAKIWVEKVITVYSVLAKLFVKVKMKLPYIKGEEISMDSATSVQEQFNAKWKEISPCEIRPCIIGNGTSLRIWKHNFLGHITYFDLDMREVDSKNKNIDCLVANMSDGYMSMSNKTNMGMLIGFNSLEAANFAFSPIKIKDKGFGDVPKKGQQIRINPFGTYWGKMLHHWTFGTGHGQEFAPKVSTTYRSTAPSFNGKSISFELVIAPYSGDKPLESIISFANHFSFPPLTIIGKKGDSNIIENYSKYDIIANQLKKENDIQDIMDLPYLEWVKLVNKDLDPNRNEIKPFLPKMGLGMLLKLLIDGIKGR